MIEGMDKIDTTEPPVVEKEFIVWTIREAEPRAQGAQDAETITAEAVLVLRNAADDISTFRIALRRMPDNHDDAFYREKRLCVQYATRRWPFMKRVRRTRGCAVLSKQGSPTTGYLGKPPVLIVTSSTYMY